MTYYQPRTSVAVQYDGKTTRIMLHGHWSDESVKNYCKRLGVPTGSKITVEHLFYYSHRATYTTAERTVSLIAA